MVISVSLRSAEGDKESTRLKDEGSPPFRGGRPEWCSPRRPNRRVRSARRRMKAPDALDGAEALMGPQSARGRVAALHALTGAGELKDKRRAAARRRGEHCLDQRGTMSARLHKHAAC